MYQAVLTRTYLTTKVMPLLAAAAVMLCTAMVLIVWSVMGGFLSTLLASGARNNGDVTIAWPNQGFAYYGELIADLERDGRIASATPVIETFAMVSLPDDRLEGITVRGIDPESYAKVIDLEATLHWKPINAPVSKDVEGRDPRLPAAGLTTRMERALREGLSLAKADPTTGATIPAANLGIELCGLSQRQPGNWYDFRPLPWVKMIGKAREDGTIQWINDFMPNRSITLRVLPLSMTGRAIELATLTLPVANEYRTGVYEADRKSVIVPLKDLQRTLQMDEARTASGEASIYDPDAPITPDGVSPARVTAVIVRAEAGLSGDDILADVERVYGAWADRHPGQVPTLSAVQGRLIQTFAMKNAQMVGAVEKETGLVLFILAFISFTASFLILAIFWAMVSEKTKDVGILRALGASRAGIAWVWVRYGLVIGVIGAVLGGLLALLVVSNINAIHDWMGSALGLQIWDPKVYYFTEIPSRINPWHAAIVLTCGALTSLIGAIIPAWRAATMDPVRALRFE